jgi:2-polyprenyl-3-methyl-5-hydroxy-6-metoxy-1,4-benzoquinol methylase
MESTKALAAKSASALSEQDVIEAYWTLLGREPESHAVVREKIQTHTDAFDLWRNIAGGPEFKDAMNRARSDQAAFSDQVRAGYWARPRQIDFDVSPALMSKLVARVKAQWTVLGEQDPYWSVLTNPRYQRQNMDAGALAEFHDTGASDAGIIALFEERTGSQVPGGVCLELGCGVGRITRHLAKRFEKVIAVDISPGNLAICRDYMDESGVTNVETVRLNDLNELEALPRFDMFYSLIVLQHNSPPIQRLIMRTLLSKLNPGGAALFQIPTDVENYSFDVADYLASPSPVMEIHSMPKPVVLRLLREAGLDVLDMVMDEQLGSFGSHTFFAGKPGKPGKLKAVG